ncbi:MAG: radical SAM protein [Sarcina sp.]
MAKVVAIWVTTKCNLMCRYCYEGAHNKGVNMSLETCDDVIRFIKTFKKDGERIIIDFHGGEPLINFEAIEYIVKKCNEVFIRKELDYCITTNGVLLNDDISKFLIENINYSLSVSLDGKQETHDFNRKRVDGKGSFEKAFDGAKKILEERPDVRARLTFDKKNINDLYDNLVYLIENNFKCIVPGIDWFCKEWEDTDFETIYEQLLAVKTYLKRNDLQDVSVGTINEKIIDVGTCAGGSTSMHILPNGDFYPCGYTVDNSKYILGNVKNGLNIKKKDKVRKVLYTDNPVCEGCNNYKSCYSTRCKFANEILTGDCNFPSGVICNMENIRIKLSK